MNKKGPVIIIEDDRDLPGLFNGGFSKS